MHRSLQSPCVMGGLLPPDVPPPLAPEVPLEVPCVELEQPQARSKALAVRSRRRTETSQKEACDERSEKKGKDRIPSNSKQLARSVHEIAWRARNSVWACGPHRNRA